MEKYGPQNPVCDELHADKYRLPNESFEEAAARWAATLSDGEEHRTTIKSIFQEMRFMPAGRVQAAVGSPRNITAFNCFVGDEILDSMDSIMECVTRAAETMRRGGGDGFDFSNIRPRGDRINSLGSTASGPVSFMGIWDAMCKTILSAGHRRGAMMGVLRVDHPDIEEFIRAKQAHGELTNFNISIAVTDEFMRCVVNDKPFTLRFDGRDYQTINAKALWDEIMRANWEWAEPGVLYIDKINKENNLYYCEIITATNPCGEQPLPANGACLLGSFNLVRYVHGGKFDYAKLSEDIPPVVRAMDNVIDSTTFPLKEQELEAKDKRRMGLGLTGLANALTMCGHEYGSTGAIRMARSIVRTITFGCYEASANLAAEKGPFPAYDEEKYLAGAFIKRLPTPVREAIRQHGIRNSHLTSIAPTGTISFCADNISGGLEPVFALETERTYNAPDGPRVAVLKDYAYAYHGLRANVTSDLTTDDHVNMLLALVPFIDSAISKTINVGDSVTFDEFKGIYEKVWRGGGKGCTTFRLSGKRGGIMKDANSSEDEGAACYVNPETGQRDCG